MWKAPKRPRGEITQRYNDGIVIIYSETDGADPGYQPIPLLDEKCRLRYEEQRLGLTRYYAAKQNREDVERVIRTPRAGCVSARDVAVTEDGRRYRVGMVQTVRDVYPPSVDITLTGLRRGVTGP